MLSRILAIHLAAIVVNRTYMLLNIPQYPLEFGLLSSLLTFSIAAPSVILIYIRSERPVARVLELLSSKGDVPPDLMAKARLRLLHRPRIIAILAFFSWVFAGTGQSLLALTLGILSPAEALHLFVAVAMLQNPLVALLSYLVAEISSRHDMRLIEIEMDPSSLVLPVQRKIVYTIGFSAVLLVILISAFFLGVLQETDPSLARFLHSPLLPRVLLFVGTGLFFIVLVAVLAAKSITTPMLEVVRAMEHAEKGDLAVRAAVTSTDETALLARGFNHMVAGIAERERIKQIFGSYVSDEIRDAILAGHSARGEKTEATVLFADIRGFTGISERSTPEETVALLNEFFTAMMRAISRHSGVVNKFMGDALMALFGSPIQRKNHAELAVSAAIDMCSELAGLNGLRAKLGLPGIEIGIGIHSGPVVSGDIGSEDRREFTVIGDTVNIAARIESATREAGSTILISEKVHQATNRGVSAGSFRLKGKTEPMVLYRVEHDTGRP